MIYKYYVLRVKVFFLFLDFKITNFSANGPLMQAIKITLNPKIRHF